MASIAPDELSNNLWLGLCDNRNFNEECTKDCSASVILEGSINGKYMEEEELEMPGCFENGEYETESMSVVSTNHKLFRVRHRGHPGYTLEPRCHLKNAALHFNGAIGKHNQKYPKNPYKGKKMPVPNIDELKKNRKHQCMLCGQLLSSVEKFEKHKTFHGCGKPFL